MSTRLSIIVPVYNVAQYLQHCLQSLSDQALDACEVILVNDASSDGCREICMQWCQNHPSFHLYDHAHNKGLSAARNTGLAHATGRYVTFVDSDDCLSPGTLKECMEKIEEGAVVEYPVSMGYLSKDAYRWQPCKGMYDFATWMKRDGHTHCFACNKVYDIHLWEGVSFPEGRYFEDILTVPYVLRKARKIIGIHTGLYCYRNREGSISRSSDPQVLHDLMEALVRLKEMPENAGNTTLYVRCLNAQLSYMQHGGKERMVKAESIPWKYLCSSGIPIRQRLKALWFKLTYYGK